MRETIKELTESWKELEYEEKKDWFESIVGWASLFGILFMLSVIGG